MKSGEVLVQRLLQETPTQKAKKEVPQKRKPARHPKEKGHSPRAPSEEKGNDEYGRRVSRAKRRTI